MSWGELKHFWEIIWADKLSRYLDGKEMSGAVARGWAWHSISAAMNK